MGDAIGPMECFQNKAKEDFRLYSMESVGDAASRKNGRVLPVDENREEDPAGLEAVADEVGERRLCHDLGLSRPKRIPKTDLKKSGGKDSVAAPQESGSLQSMLGGLIDKFNRNHMNHRVQVDYVEQPVRVRSTAKKLQSMHTRCKWLSVD